MFTVCAFLPFLPLIEDSMIRQLGDDDFAKREAATRFLARALRDTDGLRNYSLLLKIKGAHKHEGAEVRRRSQALYTANRPRYFKEFPYIVIKLRKDNIGERLYEKEAEKIKSILGDLRPEAVRWGHTPDFFYVICSTKNLAPKQVRRLRDCKETIEITPSDIDQLEPKRRRASMPS